MSLSIFKSINSSLLFSAFFLASLLSALFYTGNNVWLFTTSYIFIISIIALVLRQQFYHHVTISLNGIVISASLLLAWFAVSIFPSQIKYLSLYNFFWVGSLIIVFLLFSFNHHKDAAWNMIWPGVLFFITLWAIYGLIQYYYLRVPANATFLNRNSLAALINLAIIPASAYFLLRENERPWKILNNKLLSVILIILFLTLFIITGRGASLSLMLGLALMFLLLKKQLNKTQLYSYITLITVAVLIATFSRYITPDLPQGFSERMASLQNITEAGNPRFIIWESLLPLFNEMPWFGLGMGSLWVFWPPHRSTSDTSAGFFAHNDYMQITLEAGYPGILLLGSLFIFIVISLIHTLKNDANKNILSLTQRVELVGMFTALLTFAAHSFLTYNFYILPLLIIAGLYLARFNQLVTLNTKKIIKIPALRIYFKSIIFKFCLSGIVFILASYFISIALSSDYNNEAKKLMLQNNYQDSNALFLKAQALAPLMDNPFFSHADLLRRGANKLISVNKTKQANTLLLLAHNNLNKAEKLHPLRPQTHHIRGLIYERNQIEKAKIHFNKALKLDPRFLFSRIRLATLLHQQNQLKKALEVLYDGVSYNYPVNSVMLEYMTVFARFSREAGVESFALHLEENIKKFDFQIRQKRSNSH